MEVLGVSRTVFRRWVKNGTIPYFRDADTNTMHYPRPQLEQLAQQLRTTHQNHEAAQGAAHTDVDQAPMPVDNAAIGHVDG